MRSLTGCAKLPVVRLDQTDVVGSNPDLDFSPGRGLNGNKRLLVFVLRLYFYGSSLKPQSISLSLSVSLSLKHTRSRTLTLSPALSQHLLTQELF